MNMRANNPLDSSESLSRSLPNIHSWGECADHMKAPTTPFIIGVAGGTASGKTTVCDAILKALALKQTQHVVIISQDSFYKPLSEEERRHAEMGYYNFDHPSAFDWNLIESTLRDLKHGKPVKIPQYDFVTHSRLTDKATDVYAIDIILFEGILAFYQQDILSHFDVKIFVDTEDDIRLARRILRDMSERGRDIDNILMQYQRFVKPAFEEYILPTKKYADVIIPRGADNYVAINLIAQHVKSKLEEKEREKRPPPHIHFEYSSRMKRGEFKALEGHAQFEMDLLE